MPVPPQFSGRALAYYAWGRGGGLDPQHCKKKKKIHETKVGLVICFKLSFKKKIKFFLLSILNTVSMSILSKTKTCSIETKFS
jgi:hypothetical protein